MAPLFFAYGVSSGEKIISTIDYYEFEDTPWLQGVLGQDVIVNAQAVA